MSDRDRANQREEGKFGTRELRAAIARIASKVEAETATPRPESDPAYPTLRTDSDTKDAAPWQAFTQRPWEAVGWADCGDDTVVLFRDEEGRLWCIGDPGHQKLEFTIVGRTHKMTETEPGAYLVTDGDQITDDELQQHLPEVSNPAQVSVE